MFKRIWNVIFLSMMLSSVAFSLEMNPSFFEKDISGGKGYAEYTISSGKAKEKRRYKIDVKPFNIKDMDISKYMEVYPKVVTVYPGETSTIKVFVNLPKKKFEYKEYGFYLRVMGINIPKLKEEKLNMIESSVNVPIALNMQMFAHYGEASDKEMKEKVRLDECVLYEKEGTVYVKGKLKNELWYGFLPKIVLESHRGRKRDYFVPERVSKLDGEIYFEWKLRKFEDKEEVKRIIIEDCISGRVIIEKKL